jgi:uncharacterized protein (DUF885 family)
MRLKSFRFTLLTAVAALSACAQPADEAAPADPAEALRALADDYVAMRFRHVPEAWNFGLQDLHAPDHAGVSDISPEGQARLEADEDALLARLEAIDPDTLDDRADWVTHVSLHERLQADIGLRVCRRELWSLNHMGGWQIALLRLSDLVPVETQAERDGVLARWSGYAALIAQDRANLERGLDAGYSAPKSVTRRVIDQLDALIAEDMTASPLFGPGARAAEAGDFQAELATVLERDLRPALQDYRDYLVGPYLEAAREEIAVSALPDGEACYHAYLRSYTSLPRTAQQTFDLGSQTVAANRRAVIERGTAKFGTGDFEEILRLNNEADGNGFDTEAALIEHSREVVALSRIAVEPYFGPLPEQEMVVEPIPDALRGTGQSSSYQSSLPENGPGAYRIASDRWETTTRGGSEITAVHEGWPGHHLQIATAQQIDGLHPALRLARVTAYIEGWARYSEALAEEAGIYSEVGYAQITRRAWPARGMVVDPGLHMLGWSREEARAFLRESGRFQGPSADAMIDRIAVIPGQLTAYDTGGLEIFALRAEAEARLGEEFDIRAFHTRVLENGALPLSALRDSVESLINDQEALQE